MTSGIEYNFDASVVGLGGYYVRDGRQTLVPSIASTVLSPSGGEGWSNVTNYDTPDIGFTRAESRVRGYRTSDGIFTTVSDIYITNLRMFDTVRIALLQATVTSTRNLAVAADESAFQLQALYRGIDIEGSEVVPVVDVDICTAPYSTLVTQKSAELAASGNSDALLALTGGGPVRSTVVSRFDQTGQALADSQRKHVLVVPGFAKFHFGELLAKQGRRRVSLLRLDFNAAMGEMANKDGGSHSGSVTIASVGGNGEPIWP